MATKRRKQTRLASVDEVDDVDDVAQSAIEPAADVTDLELTERQPLQTEVVCFRNPVVKLQLLS